MQFKSVLDISESACLFNLDVVILICMTHTVVAVGVESF